MANASSLSGNQLENGGMLTFNTSSSTFSTPSLNHLLNQITTIKLDRGDFLLWKNLALPTTDTNAFAVGASSSQTVVSDIETSKIEKVLNPVYEAWLVVD